MILPRQTEKNSSVHYSKTALSYVDKSKLPHFNQMKRSQTLQ